MTMFTSKYLGNTSEILLRWPILVGEDKGGGLERKKRRVTRQLRRMHKATSSYY